MSAKPTIFHLLSPYHLCHSLLKQVYHMLQLWALLETK